MICIENIDRIDSPALLVLEDGVRMNILLAKDIAGDVSKLRPHVKSHKILEICQMMLDEGITKFKCATIAEAEMLALAKAPDIMLAYQPVGPKIQRLLKLIEAYPHSHFSCLVDSEENARHIDKIFSVTPVVLDVLIDVNTGMNRTGICPVEAIELIKNIHTLEHIRIIGLHGYDGQIHDTNPAVRQQAADLTYEEVDKVNRAVQPLFDYSLTRVLGGTRTFPAHARRPDVECSPGTFVFWDWVYKHALPEMEFHYAALVITRVISIIDKNRICLDLGHKSIASENPLPRVHFLNVPEATPFSHSEEHLVVTVPDSSIYPLGTVFYGVPDHICPTVAAYEEVHVVRNNEVVTSWRVIAGDRRINI
ncbi:threonine aldolase [Bacteroidia bacterium]|nr:threonine aldolase [Bacteroidia bacterium]